MELNIQSHNNDCENNLMNYSLYIPRYSQKFCMNDWPKGLLIEERSHDYWSDRCCGLACLRMVISHYKIPIPTQLELLKEGLKRKYYISKGWLHQGLADLGEMYGVKGNPIVVKSGKELENLLVTKGPVICSIAPKFPKNGSKGGHLVVVCGRIHTSKGRLICFRDPSLWGETNSIVFEDRFFSSFSGRAIVFSLD